MKIFILLIVLLPLHGIDKSFYQGKDTKLTDSVEFDRIERILDNQILELNKRVEFLVSVLDTLTITRMPARIVYNNQLGYHEITTFLETVQQSYLSEIQIKTIRMNFENKKFSKFQVIISKQDYRPVAFTTDALIDTDPLKLNKNHIEILSKLLDSIHRTSIGDFENNAIYPLRIRVKRDFIIPTLQYAIHNLQLIREYNFQQEVDKEKELIKRMKHSGRY